MAAPAMKCWQPCSSAVTSSTSRTSPSTRRYAGWSSYDRATLPYLEWLSSPTTSWPACNSASTT